MKLVPDAVSRKIAKQILVGQKHSPTILFTGGVTGVVVSTVLACRATLKLDEVLETAAEKKDLIQNFTPPVGVSYTDEERKKDLAVFYVQTSVECLKLYGPAILIGTASVAALTGSHRILSKRNAALTAAYAGAERAFKEYRDRVIAEVGEDKERDIYFGAESRTIVEETDQGPKKVQAKSKTSGSQYAAFFDETNVNWQPNPEHNVTILKAQQMYANDRLRTKGFLVLNDVYRALGLPETSAGAVVGWVWGHKDSYVDFGLGDWPNANDYLHGREGAILLDFNVDGVIYDLIDQRSR